MATISVDSTQEIEAILHDQIRGLLEQKAYEVENVAKRLVASGGGGRTYTTIIFRKGGKLYSFGKRAKAHTASAPGTPPATDTGRLLGSISHSVGEDGQGLYGRVTASAYYTLYLELGTRYAAPRPFLRPALYSVTG